MNKKRTQSIVYSGLLIAILAVMAFVPQLGFIQIGPFSATIMHIPVIVAIMLFGFKSAILQGTVFGLLSMIVAAMRGTIDDLLFINPLVSVLPRILFAIVGYLVFVFISRVVKNDIAKYSITAILVSLMHSVLVVSAMYLSISMGFAEEFASTIQGGFLAFMVAILGVQALVEAGVATVVSVPVVKALKKVVNQK